MWMPYLYGILHESSTGRTENRTVSTRFSAEALEALSEATAPPMKTIKVGTGEGEYTLGGETVLYRHEKTYVNKTRYAVSLCSCMDDATIDAKIAAIPAVDYERIGERMHT